MRLEPEMRCIEVVELVTDYVERRLPGAEAERFELHLTACDGCTGYLDQMRATIAATGRLRDEDVPTEFRDRLLAMFRDGYAGGEG